MSKKTEDTFTQHSDTNSKIGFQTTSTRPMVPIAEMKSEVPVTISLKLQSQCSYMCAKEPNREWSGVLFYSTTGAFGEPGFAITAEEFYLMDIGTSTFTGYDYEPDLISYMMSNPRLLALKKGHIHSHNTMNVFFSGTDTDEIRDNSEFHNYYFSLIVNNKNEMTAKVAFRGKQKVRSATSYSYKGDNGAEKTGFYETESESEICYVYNCKIDSSFHDDLMKKYQVIKSRPTINPIIKTIVGPHGTTASQEELPFPKKEKSFYWEDESDWDSVTGEAKVPKTTDVKCLSFISKVMIGDILNEEDPLAIIKRFSAMDAQALSKAQGRIEKRLVSFYVDYFPEDSNLTLFEDIMGECQELVQMYDKKYDRVTDMLWEAFNVEIK